MKKLHMGTVSYGFDSMDEVAHQLAMAFGSSNDFGECDVQCMLDCTEVDLQVMGVRTPCKLVSSWRQGVVVTCRLASMTWFSV